MGERRFTLLELHFHNHGDVQVGPKRRSTEGERLRDRLRRRRGGDDAAGGRSLPLPALTLALVALAAWWTLRGR